MLVWRSVPVTDATAHALLEEYFQSRELGFAQHGRAYRATFPDAEPFTPPEGEFLVVVEDDLEVGCGGIRRVESEPGDGPRYEVKHLWMRPVARGRGYGRALLDELERRAAGFGAREIVLDTHESLIAAGALYASQGYRRIAPYNDNPNATHWFAKAL